MKKNKTYVLLLAGYLIFVFALSCNITITGTGIAVNNPLNLETALSTNPSSPNIFE